MHAEAYVVLICFNKVSIKLKTVQAAQKKKVWKSVDGSDEDGNISIISFLTITPTT